MNAVEVNKLSFTYKDSDKKALDNVNLKVKKGEFVLIMGPSGAGKSTLCMTLNGIIPNLKSGEYQGGAKIFDRKVKEFKVSDCASDIVLVFQDFEYQLFSTSVELEVAFGPENFGIAPEEIGKRISDVLERVRLKGMEKRQPATLSGGQKQRLAIASVLSIQPRVICMDEPTTDLDPVGKYDILKIAEELRTDKEITMIVVEHETEEALKADRVIIMKEGKIVKEGPAKEILSNSELLKNCSIKPLDVADYFSRMGIKEVPVTPEEGIEVWKKEGLKFNKKRYDLLVNKEREDREKKYGQTIIEINGLVHQYENGVKALKGVDLTIREGEFIAVLGQNGSGKTTLVRHINGLLTPTEGSVIVCGLDTRKESIFKLSKKVGYAFQNPDHQIFAGTVFEEVAYGPKLFGLSEEEVKKRVEEALAAVDLTGSEEEDPFSLTKGERQRVAVASILAAKPQVIILDEPTTGLDYREQRSMMELIKRLNEMGHTIIMVTHSMWVTAEYAHRVVVIRDGKVMMDGNVREVFARGDELEELYLKPPQIVRFGNMVGATVLSVDELITCTERQEG